MKTLSRQMPELTKGTYAGRAFAYCVIGLFLTAVAWLCFTNTVALIIVSLNIIYLVIATIKDNKRLRKIAEERVGDNICTFARAFDRRTVDPWTIRAAYDELQEYFCSIGRPFPIRASDRFQDDLKMDGDDLCDLLFAIAERSGHDITFLDAKPQIHTIGELVTCISNLPKIEEAEQAAA